MPVEGKAAAGAAAAASAEAGKGGKPGAAAKAGGSDAGAGSDASGAEGAAQRSGDGLRKRLPAADSGSGKAEGAGAAAKGGAKAEADSDAGSGGEESGGEEVPEAEDEDEGKPGRELPPPKVTLGDVINMKRVLDEAVVRAFEEATPFQEDYRWGNLKLLIMAVSCAAALIAQFYPLPFPDNRALLGVCVAVYFALSGVLQYMVSFLDKDVIYASQPLQLQPAPEAGAGAAAAAAGAKPVAVLRTSLPRASSVYSCTLEYPAGTELATLSRGVGAYFASTGFLVPEAVAADIAALVRPHAAKWGQGEAQAAQGGKGAKGGAQKQRQQGQQQPAKGAGKTPAAAAAATAGKGKKA